MKIIVMGTPTFAVPAFESLRQAGHMIIAAYTQPPRPAGRGQQLMPSPVQLWAEQAGIPVYCPLSLKNPQAQADFAAHQADVAIVAAYGLILPNAVLNAPRYGCLNIHASLLPRWRGAAPIQRAIMAGDTHTGITIMQMDQGLDTGAMLLQKSIPITSETNGGNLFETLAQLGATMITDVCANILMYKSQPQPTDGITYAHKIHKVETKIDWTQPAMQIERCMRAFSPAPGMYCLLGDVRLKVLAAHLMDASGAIPGMVLDNKLGIIACGTHALQLNLIQLPGKKPQAATQVFNANPLPTILG
jgi:methionyl-tRNA formyltransferase